MGRGHAGVVAEAEAGVWRGAGERWLGCGAHGLLRHPREPAFATKRHTCAHGPWASSRVPRGCVCTRADPKEAARIQPQSVALRCVAGQQGRSARVATRATEAVGTAARRVGGSDAPTVAARTQQRATQRWRTARQTGGQCWHGCCAYPVGAEHRPQGPEAVGREPPLNPPVDHIPLLGEELVQHGAHVLDVAWEEQNSRVQ